MKLYTKYQCIPIHLLNVAPIFYKLACTYIPLPPNMYTYTHLTLNNITFRLNAKNTSYHPYHHHHRLYHHNHHHLESRLSPVIEEAEVTDNPETKIISKENRNATIL